MIEEKEGRERDVNRHTQNEGDGEYGEFQENKEDGC